MKFYVGAPLKRWESARKTMSSLRSLGHEITHDWTLEAEEHFAGRETMPHDVIARSCVDGVAGCDVAFFLFEDIATPMQGTWAELGAALALHREVVVYLPQLNCHPDLRPSVEAWVRTALFLAHPNVTVEANYADCFIAIDVIANQIFEAEEARRKSMTPLCPSKSAYPYLN